MTQLPEDDSVARSAAADSGPLVPPDDWSAAPGVGPGQPAPAPYAGERAPTTGAPVSRPGSRGEQLPGIDGLVFDRARELDSRAVIGIVLSGIAAASIAAWFVGAPTPLLLTVAAATGGVVMGLRGWIAARRGLASNGRLGLAAVVLGVLALAGVVGIYALVIMAIGQLTG